MDFNSIIGNAKKKMTDMAKPHQGSGSGKGNSNSSNPAGAKQPDRLNPHETGSYSGFTADDLPNIVSDNQLQSNLAQVKADSMSPIWDSISDAVSPWLSTAANPTIAEARAKNSDFINESSIGKMINDQGISLEFDEAPISLGTVTSQALSRNPNAVAVAGMLPSYYPQAVDWDRAHENEQQNASKYTGGIPTRAQLYESFYNNPEALSGLNDEWGTMYRSGTDTRADAPKEIYKDYVRRTGANKLWGLDAMEAWQAEHPYTPVSPDGPEAEIQNALALMPYMGGTVGSYIGGIGGFDKAFDPWYDYYKKNLDLRNINNDQWTQELIAGMNDAEARDFADWLVADRYGANGELYNWASAVIPDYLESTGNYNPNSESMYMLNNTSYEPGSQEALEQQSRVADALYLQRISQLMQDENNKTAAIPSNTIDRLSRAAGGGFRTASDSYNGPGKKITPYSGEIKDWGYEDILENMGIKDELTARDILNIRNEITGEYPYRGNQIVKE